ncbi:hypothetical protein [Corallococcus silvisoli]|uniref:hypothetical protein n=1 Tax=Corallococcus silvisoli TaxID=2697031 RepID=UPI001376FCC9|nr:hypothetical protein [Corallococcus silvisoli]NBD08481.1 hypothetical protein [Corallococcus silvisoli]
MEVVLEERKSVVEVARDMDLTEMAFRRGQAKTDKGIRQAMSRTARASGQRWALTTMSAKQLPQALTLNLHR